MDAIFAQISVFDCEGSCFSSHAKKSTMYLLSAFVYEGGVDVAGSWMGATGSFFGAIQRTLTSLLLLLGEIVWRKLHEGCGFKTEVIWRFFFFCSKFDTKGQGTVQEAGLREAYLLKLWNRAGMISFKELSDLTVDVRLSVDIYILPLALRVFGSCL